MPIFINYLFYLLPTKVIAGFSLWTTVYLLVASVAFGLLIRGIWETGTLDTTYVKIGEQQLEKPLRLVFFSDLHAEHLRLKSGKLILEIIKADPDVVIFGGDLTAKPDKLSKAIEFMRQIREYDYKKNILFLAIPGNHDTPESLHALSEVGFLMLNNSDILYSQADKTWQFIGLADLQNGLSQISIVTGAENKHEVPPEQKIVIAHNPDSILGLPEKSALLFLSGHFHGGQIWAPFRLEFKVLRDEKLASMGYTRGLFRMKNMYAYISRGIGCVLIPLRFLSQPELTIIDMWQSNKQTKEKQV